MKLFFRRVGALMDRDGRDLLRRLPAMLLLLTLLAAGCVFLCQGIISDIENDTQRLKIGVVDKDGSMVSQLAVGIVAANEEVAALFEVVNFDEAQAAMDAVAASETVAAIIFEEGYFDKVLAGESSAISVILSREMELHSQMIRDFAGTGEILIKTGEYGVNAAWYPVMDAFDNETVALMKFNTFSMKFAVELLSLTGLAVDGVVLDYSDRAGSVEGHYILHYTVLLLTLLDMLFFDFIRRDCNRTFLCRLKSAGVGAEHILAAKLPFLLATKTGLLAVVLVVMALIFGLNLTVWTVLSAVCFLIFSSVIGVCLCALLQKSDVGPCILCALGFAGMFLCGGLVAYDMLPKAVTQWSILTPMGIGASMLSPMFGGSVTVAPYVLGLVMCVALCVAAWYYTGSLRVKGSEQA